ncbi:MAG TPA: PQQ-binding-like beta-propeller repeat protein [Anaerolineae bacterium]|nr:PQQ-binding-like beta-propeller repeat protein [Anaerolineae bacterium]
MTQRSRVIAAALGLLLLALVLSACGAAPVAETWPGLTVDDGIVYAISGQPAKVYMLDAETGAVKQTFPQSWLELVGDQAPKGVVYWSPVAVGEGQAFVGFSDTGAGTAGLYAFDPETGMELWRVPVELYIQDAPTYAAGVVYAGDTAGYVWAVDAESHSVKPGWPFETESAIWASPLVDGGRVYVAAMDHRLYCLDAETGELIWEQDVGAAMAAPPILEDGILYVGAFDGKEHAFRADTGERVEGFSFEAQNWIWSEALMVADKLFVTSLDGKLYALEPTSGNVLAPYPYDSSEIDGKKDVIRAAPVQAGESIIIGTESGRVIAVRDAQRGCYWPTGLPESTVLTTPVVWGDKLYVILTNGQIHTLDINTLESGTCAAGWSWSPPQGG